MATIGLMPFHWSANLNATFALARNLLKNGHRVVYLSVLDTEDRISAQGFEFTPIFERVFSARGPRRLERDALGRNRRLGASGSRRRFLEQPALGAGPDGAAARNGLDPEIDRGLPPRESLGVAATPDETTMVRARPRHLA